MLEWDGTEKKKGNGLVWLIAILGFVAIIAFAFLSDYFEAQSATVDQEAVATWDDQDRPASP